MAKEPFESSARKPRVPANLGAKLILFKGIEEDSPYETLEGKLLLVSEDEKGSGYICGYVINQPLQKRLRTIFRERGIQLPESFAFKQMLDAGADNFEMMEYEADIITFITPKKGELRIINEHTFGSFTAYACETIEEARHMATYLAQIPHIVSQSMCFIDRDGVADLIRSGQALVRPALPQIVFNQSAYMRTKLAFPDQTP